ncbi:NTP transferase domain-containing protein [Massilia sp. CF038]|uniref:nucleotidyltransferase family protein n=1 Tax=Massilia sp. CF038 TaxID=1881045 RepID=UPI0009188F65|nr:nucleotidyltransferase family protein [Massilia sp. CF038]SHH72026.1 molybdenum cofactor cytidylyltransferase [Massilia sp. CF038]
MNIVGLLLAAGRGRRFDPAGQRNKLLAALPDGDMVAVASARALLAVLPRVIAVVPAEGALADALRNAGCDVTVCVDADSGIAASLVHGVQQAKPADGWIIGLGDMPRVAPATICALRDALRAGAGIAAPVHAGRRGNPVAFNAMYLPRLLALTGDQGARALLASEPVMTVPVIDAGILHDIDTPSDLDKTGTLPLGGPA